MTWAAERELVFEATATARPARDGERVNYLVPVLSASGGSTDYFGGSMRRRHGIDEEDDEPPELADAWVEPG